MATTATLLGDRYQLQGLIARGGMADVYRATDTRLQRPVAIKLLRDATEASRFEREMHTLATLRHPGIVSLLDAGSTAEGTPFLVLELRREPTLATRLSHGPIAPERVLTIARGLAEALAYLHERGVVHRDVKPGNVFVDEHDTTRLTDFGIARVAGAGSLTATGFTMGTARYLAPEQVTGGNVTPAVDVYALALVMIECLSGEPAFSGTQAEVATARLVRGPDLPPSTPPGWRALLGAMTSRDPELRPAAARVAVELAALDTGTATDAVPTAVLPVGLAAPARRPRRRNLIVLGALAAATLAGVVAAVAGGGSSGGGSASVTTSTTVASVVSTAPPIVNDTTTSTPSVVLNPDASVPKPSPKHRGGHGGTRGDHGGGGGD